MKNRILVLMALLLSVTIQAQVRTPQASPRANVFQTVGLTDIEVNYSRPSAKGRPVFGNLVPFGKLWRTGANDNTTVSFSDDVVIDGKTLKKGKYALFTVPRIESWDIIFYSKTDNRGIPKEFNEEDVALRTTVKADALLKFVETFTIGVSSLDMNFAYLEIYWENSYVAIKIELQTQKTTMDNIEKVLAGPTAVDYYTAGNFLYMTNGDNEKALSYVNKALEMSEEKPFWYNRLKSLVLARKGDKKGAIEAAKLSLEAAEVAKNQDYVKMNNDSIAEWSKS